MQIELDTKINTLLDSYPDLEEVFFKISPVFGKLKNPVLRRTVAKVTTLQQAAKIGGVSPNTMLQTLRRAVGLNTEHQEAGSVQGSDQQLEPSWLDRSKISTRLDVGAIIERGDTPMMQLMQLSAELEPGFILEFGVPFRPEPIIEKLKAKHFDAWYDTASNKCYVYKQQ